MINKTEILAKAKDWFRESIAENHIRNTEKLRDAGKFNINPFLATYLANFLTGTADANSIAKAMIYPRVLGTSITTSFGTNIQHFTNQALDAFGSTTSGIDIEFTDQTDGRKKFCQLKSGPNTINKDDVETIADHFSAVRRLSQTNNLRIPRDDMIVGIIHGSPDDINGHYRRITNQYDFPVIIGQDFWHRLTGDPEFYHDLITAIGDVASEANFSKELDEVVKQLANSPEVQALADRS